MRWKLLLATLLLLSIATLVFLKFGPMQIISGMLGLFSSAQPLGVPFPVELTANANAFYGQKYEISFSQLGINIDKIALGGVSGEVKRFKNNQWFPQILNNGTVEIYKFVGHIKFGPNMSTITLSGHASRVRGTNFEGSIFEWVG